MDIDGYKLIFRIYLYLFMSCETEGKIGVCRSTNTRSTFATFVAQRFILLCEARMKTEKRNLPCLVRCRLSASELEKHKELVKSLNITSQKFLYLHVLNYRPKTDVRLSLVQDLLKYIEKANEITRKMKLYIEADPFEPPAEVKYWSADTVAVFHQRLNDLLTKDIHPRLEDIFSKDPHKKLIREEVRTTESEKFTKTLVVRVKPEDRELIKANAEQCMLSVSTYIRFIATGKQPQSRDCIKACRSMAKVSGNLGRIKGIMHYWMGTESKIEKLPEKTRNLIYDNARESLGNKVLASKIMQQFHYMVS